VGEVGKKHAPFGLELTKISYGPPKRKPPRMVWAGGPVSVELGRLEQGLRNSLYETMRAGSEGEAHGFSPHITLGRLKQWEFQRQEIDEVPEIDETISVQFPVDSIEVMESELKREGPEYHVLESSPLSQEA